MTRIADTIAATLHAHRIRHAFGMPGGEVVTLIDGLEAAGIRFHLARHETAAAIMAAGASVTTATPGLLVATVGPRPCPSGRPSAGAGRPCRTCSSSPS